MNPSLIRNLSVCARNLFVTPPSSTQPLAAASSCCQLRHFSSDSESESEYDSESDSGDESSSIPARSDGQAAPAGDDDVTEEELKSRIEKFYRGDEDAIPSILEGILKRKLAGKNDQDLIDQLPCETSRRGEGSDSDDEEEDVV